MDILRVFAKDLASLDKHGKPCEICDSPMNEHEWVDLAFEGYVVACSIEEKKEKVNDISL